MSTISIAKFAISALKNEKPHVRAIQFDVCADRLLTPHLQSSISDLVEILTSTEYDDEAFDGFVIFVFCSCCRASC